MIFLKSVKWRKGLSLSATFLFTLLVLAACKKHQTKLGKDAIDSDEYLISGGIDTFKLTTSSVFADSVESGDTYYNFLGSYNDPVFGTVDASFFTQLRLSGLSPNFGDLTSVVIDSFVLGLQYAGNSAFYGDLTNQKIEVYQLTNDLNSDSIYYTFSNVGYNTSNNLVVPGTETFKPDLISNTIIDTTKVPGQIRVHLDPMVAMDLMQHSQSNASDFASQSAFLSYFKGLYIKTANGYQAPGTGAVFYLDTKTALSKLTIYYTQASVKKRFDFLINSECVDFNKLNIQRSISNNVQEALDTKSKGMNEYYAQANEIKAKIEMPGISNLPKNTIIHRAELEIPVSYQDGYKYGIGNYVRIQRDYSSTSSSKVNYTTNGYYDISRKAFIIDLRVYAQSVVSGIIDNTGIYVFPDYFDQSVDRIVFNGPNSINKKKPKLTLKYTEF
ncbi:MAG: DUF4270 domain-containing protein [Fluviicola sp.]|nr:DUF4270 domain-containing protein [Fluviicola sp.]